MSMSDLYFECKYIIAGANCEKLIKNGAILIEDNRIAAVGTIKKIKKLLSGHDRFNRLSHIAIPSLINSHTHLPETLLRGICDNEKLDVWLNKYIWPFEHKLSATDSYFGALLGCLELIESGISGFIDQYFYSEKIEEAAQNAKIRALLCPSIFDNTPESGSLENTWKDVSNLIIRKQSTKSELVKYGLGPHAPYTVPKDYLIKVKELASRYTLPIHIHLNETKLEVKESQEKFGLSPIEYIESIGLTNSKILAAHCVHTTEKERLIMKNSNFTVLHNPQSNLKMSSGIAPIYNYLELGIPVAVGTDGNASNNDLAMIEELSVAGMLQKYLSNNPKVMNNSLLLSLGTVSGLNTMGFESKGISENSLADITILGLEKSHSWPQNDPLSNVLYSSSSSDVTDLIVNGNIVYLNREHLTLNKASIIEKCGKIAARIITEMGN